jgi:O-antigen ligase
MKIRGLSEQSEKSIVLTIAVVFFATAFLSFDNLIETQLLSKSYAFIAGVIGCCVAVLMFRKRVEVSFDLLTAIAVLLVGYIILRMGIAGQFNLKFLLAAAFLLTYLFFKTIGHKYDDHIAPVIVLVCVSQAVYGLLQWVGVCYSGGFRMMGSFDNPAGIAALLSAGLPFCFSLTSRTKLWRYAGWISFGIIISAIFLSGSRTGIIAAIVITGLFFVDRYKTFFKRYNVAFISLGVIFCILGGAGLFYLKKDSAMGRLLIWETSAQMIQDKPVFGHGSGGFMADYMTYQADYFENDTDSKYSQLADNVTHPFNEYISLTVEYGLVVLVILLTIAVTILCNIRKITPSILCITSIAIFSCFSYPTRYACVLLLLAYDLANLDLPIVKHIRLNIGGRIVGIAIVALLAFQLVRDIRFEYKWGQLVRLSSLGKTSELLSDYADLHEDWNRNPLFLYNYGAVLNKAKDFSNSNAIMSQCEKYYNDYDVQMLIADNLFNLSDWNKSIEHYELASRMCPGRFMPLYRQFLIYETLGNNEKTHRLAVAIQHKSVKIGSAIIHDIKHETLEYINSCSSE